MRNELANENAKKEKFKKDAEELQIKLNRAEELIRGLSGEYERWT